jgi:catecholate siderophore receptor
LALAALAATPVYANDSDSAPYDELEEIQVYGQRNDGYLEERMQSPQYTADLLDTARTINIISSEVIRDQAADSLSDILSNVPGISMQAGEGGTPAGDQLTIRGFSARTDIFIDGVRDFGGYSRDSYLVDRVEVAKGPGSNYTGRGSTGGSINMVSKTAGAENFMFVNAALGSDEYRRATLDLNRTLSDITALRINLLAHDAGVPGRDEVENTRYGFAPTMTFGVGTASRVILSYSHLEQDNVPDYGIPWVAGTNTALPDFAEQMAPVNQGNWYGMLERDYEEVGNDLLTARYELDMNNGLALSSQLRWGETDRDSLITAPRFAATDSTDIRRSDWKSRDQQDRIINNFTVLHGDFVTGSLQHSVATGFELSSEYEVNHERDITGEQPDTDLYHPTPHDHWGGTIYRTGGKAESDAFSTSVFLADTITLSENWLVTAGMRWDRFELEFTDTENDGSRSRYERTDSELSYQGSLVYKPTANGSIYAGYGTSFNPSGEGLTLTTRSGHLADVEPEQGDSFELGTKWELLDARLLLNAALFRSEKTNARETDPVDSSLTVLSGKQMVEGLEIGVVGRLSDQWNVLAGYTWMNSEITASIYPELVGNEMANTPNNTVSIWTTWQFLPELQLGIGTQYVDERYSASNNLRRAPSYQLYNAMASWQFSQAMGLRLNASNLGDEDYAGSIGGGHYIPGEGRSFLLSLDYQM